MLPRWLSFFSPLPSSTCKHYCGMRHARHVRSRFPSRYLSFILCSFRPTANTTAEQDTLASAVSILHGCHASSQTPGGDLTRCSTGMRIQVKPEFRVSEACGVHCMTSLTSHHLEKAMRAKSCTGLGALNCYGDCRLWQDLLPDDVARRRCVAPCRMRPPVVVVRHLLAAKRFSPKVFAAP